MTFLYHSGQGNIGIIQGDFRHGVSGRILPADNGFFVPDRVGHIGGGDLVTFNTLLCDHDLADRVREEHEVDIFKPGSIRACDRFGHGHCLTDVRQLRIAVIPADKFFVVAVGFRRTGVIQRFPVLQNLRGKGAAIRILKNVGGSCRRRYDNAGQRNTAAGLRPAVNGHNGRQRVQRRAADEHDEAHHQREELVELGFH